MQHMIEDPELGCLCISTHVRARRLTFRTKRDAVWVTVPPGTSLNEIHRAIEQLRPRLLKAREEMSAQVIDLNYNIDAELFKLTLVKGNGSCFFARSSLGALQIVCPENVDFKDDNLQAWLRKVIEEALRKQAKVILPPRLYRLSQRHHLAYKGVKVNASTGRWGSCSTAKNINLSCYLLLLPGHLIDYVLLHELAHTLEMNHGERFWALLNEWTDGKVLGLREELKMHRTALPFQ